MARPLAAMRSRKLRRGRRLDRGPTQPLDLQIVSEHAEMLLRHRLRAFRVGGVQALDAGCASEASRVASPDCAASRNDLTKSASPGGRGR